MKSTSGAIVAFCWKCDDELVKAPDTTSPRLIGLIRLGRHPTARRPPAQSTPVLHGEDFRPPH